jgi:hypothetical protein
VLLTRAHPKRAHLRTSDAALFGQRRSKDAVYDSRDGSANGHSCGVEEALGHLPNQIQGRDDTSKIFLARADSGE